MFINCSNHKSSDWSKEQLEAAGVYGRIIDIDFPAVETCLNAVEVSDIADGIYSEIYKLSPKCVMCQGEFTLTYAIVERLLRSGIKTVAACSDRKVIEKKLDNGDYQKTVTFVFAGFRDYQ